MTNLEKLNQLLKDKALSIPDFRRVVDLNGRNQKWLKKHLRANSRELVALLDMNNGQLMKTYEGAV